MAINPVPTQVVLPGAPDRNTQQGNTFSNAARTWSFALPDWGDWLNSVGLNVYNNAVEAEGFATTASAQAVAAANSASAALTYRNQTQALRDETAAIVATIPEGTINDTITTLTDTWSSSKINSELALKLDITTANTQFATKSELTTKLDLAQAQAVALYF